MNGTKDKQESTTNGTSDKQESIMNGQDGLVDSLQKWAATMMETAKAYKGASGQQSLLLRSKMTNTAKQIINAVKDPGETPFEYSVQVGMTYLRMVSVLFAYCLVDGGNGRASYAHGAQGPRQDTSARNHFLPRLGRKCQR